MILNQPETNSHITLFLNLRHDEYGFPSQEGVTETYYAFPDEGGDTYPEGAKDIRDLPEEQWAPWKSEDWGIFVEITGPAYSIVTAFQTFAGRLMPSLDPAGYTPGGDDDFFDYWPGAMECLREWAQDLEKVYNGSPDSGFQFFEFPGFMGVYHNVVVDFLTRECLRAMRRGEPEWVGEIVEDFIKEFAEDKGMKEDHVINLVTDLAKLRFPSYTPQTTAS